ncbi:MAG: DNA-processing protein DprA [Steroidobacteraceae bacterium]
MLARAPTLCASHLEALVRASDGDLTRAIELETLNSVTLPRAARASLVFPDQGLLKSDLKWIEASGAHLLASTDAHYPAQLRPLPDAPAVLFALGDVRKLVSSQLAMVGARQATREGCKIAREFAEYFASAGITITSGLALGIDAASHEGALRGGGQTVAVCATGLDRVYPTQHVPLAQRIRANGVLLSEFPPGTPPLKMNFPHRNRLISGLSRGLVVVEAATHSGSLVTARCAAKQGRPVFAIPGFIHRPLSGGCHKLIRNGATLVQSPADVLQVLGIPLPRQGLVHRRGHRIRPRAIDKGYEMLLDAVGFEPATVDVLVLRTGLSGESITSMLLALELEGRVASYPGGRFGRIP